MNMEPETYIVTVGNEHYMGSRLGEYATREDAEAAAEAWLKEMLAIGPEGEGSYEYIISESMPDVSGIENS